MTRPPPDPVDRSRANRAEELALRRSRTLAYAIVASAAMLAAALVVSAFLWNRTAPDKAASRADPEAARIARQRAEADFQRAIEHRRAGNTLKRKGLYDGARRSYRMGVELGNNLLRKFPDDPEYQRYVAITRGQIAVSFFEQKQYPEAERINRDVVAVMAELVQAHPDNRDYRREYALSLHHLGAAIYLQNRPVESLLLVVKAREQEQTFLAGAPAGTEDRELHRENIQLHCLSLADLGRHAAAATLAEQMAALDPPSWNDAYVAAWAVIRGIAPVQKDASLPEAERRALVQRYADQAVRLLQTAVQRGFNNGPFLRDDPEFKPLRDRPDFKTLLESLSRKRPRPSDQRTIPQMRA